jgi:hypothetical protein
MKIVALNAKLQNIEFSSLHLKTKVGILRFRDAFLMKIVILCRSLSETDDFVDSNIDFTVLV